MTSVAEALSIAYSITTGPIAAQANTCATTAASSSSRVFCQDSARTNWPTESGISRKIEPQHRPRKDTAPDTPAADSSHCRLVKVVRRRENSGMENVMAADDRIDVGPRRIAAPRRAPLASADPTPAMTSMAPWFAPWAVANEAKR